MRNNNFNGNRNNYKNGNGSNNNYSYAPYNFIPLSKRVIKRYEDIKDLPGHNEFVEGTLSGEIEYTIENITDLIISDGNSKFFRDVNGNFAIPGSTLRGKLRSNINILGFSAVGEDIQDERFLYRRFASKSSNLNKEYNNRLGMKIERVNGKTFSTLQNVNSGYVKKINDEEYVIIKSKEIKGKTYFRISEEDLANKYNGMSGINFMNDRRKTKSYEPYTKEISFEINDNNKGIKSIGPKDKLKNKIVSDNTESKTEQVQNLSNNYKGAQIYMEENYEKMPEERLKNMQNRQQHRKDQLENLSENIYDGED